MEFTFGKGRKKKKKKKKKEKKKKEKKKKKKKKQSTIGRTMGPGFSREMGKRRYHRGRGKKGGSPPSRCCINLTTFHCDVRNWKVDKEKMRTTNGIESAPHVQHGRIFIRECGIQKEARLFEA